MELGPRIARKIVTSMGGSLAAEGSRGEGDTFTVELPK
jgi:signal transduction histidine kinase